MNRQEAMSILAILKAAYPNSYKGMSAEDATGTASVWAMQFPDVSAQVVIMAVNKCIASSPFPPAISEVKNKMLSLHWEAYNLLEEERRDMAIGLPPTFSENKRAQLEAIKDQTGQYRYEKTIEPSVWQMLEGGYVPRIGSGA